jgi:branched-chain amino acid aminotransferase
MNGAIHTPPLANSALPGITRDSVLTLCREMGISVTEQMLPRETLYIADEVFFSGTAAEITPIRSIDRIKVGGGARGPITKRVQDAFFAITSGKVPDRHGWLSPIGVANGVAVR